jgi:hypothetical protein
MQILSKNYKKCGDVTTNMTEQIKWHEPENSNEFLTFEDVDKMMKSYSPTEFRRQYLNEPNPSKALFDKSMDYAYQLSKQSRLRKYE